ncbi:signal peptidase I [Pseudonocardia acaciae]|uniref:signal peptidase I n=1 Tax=Pseudonocardia acaciae TaxID=551276 RepID=UPI000686D436|nr:signal peptidase I [Pseudonocardia acaciae]
MNKIFAVLGGALLAGVVIASGSTAHAAEPATAPAPYPFVMPTGSMEQTIHKGQTVMAQPVTNYAGRVGDIVLFHGPPSWQSVPGDQPEVLKRVIAVGGQTVRCCDPTGRVLVDGRPLDEPYLHYLPEAGPPNQASFAPVRVPPGMLWMMGDSRNNSADSRTPGHGSVPAKSITAIVRAG